MNDIATEEELRELDALMELEEELMEEESAQEEAPKQEAPKQEAPKQEKTEKAKGLINPEEIKRDLAFNENSISEAFTSQASLFFHYAHIAQKLSFDYESKKSQLDILESRIDDEMRKEATAAGAKVTESQLAKQLKIDPRYISKVSEVNEARAKAALAKDVLEAFKQKRDMLIQMGADLREEFKGQLRMKSNEDLGERAMKALKKGA